MAYWVGLTEKVIVFYGLTGRPLPSERVNNSYNPMYYV